MEHKLSNKENNRRRFVRIAERRVNVILKNFDSLGKCSNRRNYEYNDIDVKKIFGELEKKMKEIRILFASKASEKAFKLE